MQAMQISIAAIICAAGSSNRMGGVKKEYLPLGETTSLTVLGAAVSAFASSPRIGPIVIVVPPGSEDGENAAARACLPEELRSDELFSGQNQNRIHFVSGGPTRRASVHNALLFLESLHPSHVLIHDGARPWVKPELIEKIIDAAINHGAVIPALPLTETPKELFSQLVFEDPPVSAGANNFIKRHLRRTSLCTAQTPQGFKFPEILTAHEKAEAALFKREREVSAGEREKSTKITGENFEYTDDAEIWGEFIGKVAVIPGDPSNRKITFPEDIGRKSL